MTKTNQIQSLREHDAMLVGMRRELRMDPGAYVDVIFVHREEGMGAEIRCLGCEGRLELRLDDWWCCTECGYEFSPEEMEDLFARYVNAITRLNGIPPERKKKQWAWVSWFLRLLRITR